MNEINFINFDILKYKGVYAWDDGTNLQFTSFIHNNHTQTCVYMVLDFIHFVYLRLFILI